MSASDGDVLRAILSELQTLNRTVSRIAASLAGEREIDPGDAVPPGVAPVEPVPMTPQDEEVRRRLERLG